MFSDYYQTHDSYISTSESPTTPEPPHVEHCNYYNKTHKIIFTDEYEGIPENLLLNFIGWLLLILLFAILRKKAWNYGRIALVQKNEEKWTQLFYGAMDEVSGISEADSLTSIDSNAHIDKGFCSWLTAIFRIKDESILQKCGPDAVQYLSFQRHILVYTSIIVVISLAVTLPINFQGNLQGDETTFGHTTLSNLDPNSPLLWVHVTLAILFLPLGIIIMRRFSVTLMLEEHDTGTSRTLMISRIPKKFCDVNDLNRHFREAYPEVQVQDIQLAYDITKLSSLDFEREKVYQAKLYCENHLKRTGVRLDMRPYRCGNICVCCDVCGFPTVDAIEFYAEEEMRLMNAVESERALALKKPLGIAFVTLATTEEACRIYADYRGACGCNVMNPPCSSVSTQLKPHRWQVNFAPSPKDLLWENLSLPSKYWYLKSVFVNLFLFILLFFATTPIIFINVLNKFNFEDELQKVSPVISEFLPTLVLWTFSALMPVIVSYSDQWLSHWTRSEKNHSIMTKTFTLLVFMVLILPSLGLTSAEALLRWTIQHHDETYPWECLFLPDKGAFFVNYVTTSAFIGTALELIRFPELFVYAIRLCLARSQAESASVRKAILWEFPFGVQYAWMLLIFAVTITYSLSCPLVTPFGLLYLSLKHLVDKYNLYFAYGPSKINPKIHATAINAVIISITLLQFSFLAFSILRRGLNDISIYSMIGVIITCLFLMAQIFLNWCKGFSPISYQKPRPIPTSSAESSPVHKFVPQVLQPTVERQQPDVLSVTSPAEGLSILQRTYGTGNTQAEDGVSPEEDPSSRPVAINRNASAGDRVYLYQDYDNLNTDA